MTAWSDFSAPLTPKSIVSENASDSCASYTFEKEIVSGQNEVFSLTPRRVVKSARNCVVSSSSSSTTAAGLTTVCRNDLFVLPPNSGFLPEAGCGGPNFLG